MLHKAAWNKSGQTVIMHMSSVNSGGHSVVRDGHGYTKGEYVSTISLSDLIDGQPCDLLKLDIEGAEYKVFEGADKNTLSNIRSIIMEVHGTNEQNARIVAQLKNADFTVSFKNPYLSAINQRFI